MSNEIKETFRFLSEKPSLKIVVSSGDVIEFSPYYITQDEGVAAELRKIPNIYETDSLEGASVGISPDKMILRDSQGRAKVANPTEHDDIATKGYTDTGLATKAEAVHRHIKTDIDGLEGLDNLVKSVNGWLPDLAGNVTLPMDSVKTVNANLPDEFGNITIEKEDIGLDMVDNTPDLDKPISKATQTALAELGAVDVKELQEDINGVKTKVQNGLYIKKDNSINIDNFISQGGVAAFFHALDNHTQGTFPKDITVAGFYNVFNMGFANNADEVDLGCNGQLLIMGTYAGMPTNSFVYYRPRMINSQGALEWGQWRRVILSGDVIPISDISGVLSLNKGGTGATTAAAARIALGVHPGIHTDPTRVGACVAACKSAFNNNYGMKAYLPAGGTWMVWVIAMNGLTSPEHTLTGFESTGTQLRIMPGGADYGYANFNHLSWYAWAQRIA